jgi:DNA-binding transcriptional LysR family regulator
MRACALGCTSRFWLFCSCRWGDIVDRIDAMKVFVTAVDEGSLANAGRKLGRSPAAVSRAIAFLEACVGADLLHRTTRSIKTSGAGEQYAVVCRRILTDLEEAEMVAAGERSAPRGTLTLTAPEITGEAVLRPILDAFMDAFPAVSARLYLTERSVKLIDEGIDVALRIAHLPDSTSVSIRVGEVRRVVAAAPGYLARHPRIEHPGDLARHQIIAMSEFGLESWSFPPLPGSCVPRTVHFTPRLVVNSVRGAVASAVAGCGITRVFSCQIAEQVRAGELEILLADDEEPPIPVHVLAPTGRLSVPKARAFVDFAVPRLRSYFARLANDAAETAIGSRRDIGALNPHVTGPAAVSNAQIGVRPDVKTGSDRVLVASSHGLNIPRIHPMAPRLPSHPELLAVP